MEPPLLPVWGGGGNWKLSTCTAPRGKWGTQGCLSHREAAGGRLLAMLVSAHGGPTSHNSLKAQGQGQVDPSESPPTKGGRRCPTLEGRGPTRPEFGMVTVQGAGSVQMVGPVLFLDSEAAADGDWSGAGSPDSPSAPVLTTGQRSAVSVSGISSHPRFLPLSFSKSQRGGCTRKEGAVFPPPSACLLPPLSQMPELTW